MYRHDGEASLRHPSPYWPPFAIVRHRSPSFAIVCHRLPPFALLRHRSAQFCCAALCTFPLRLSSPPSFSARITLSYEQKSCFQVAHFLFHRRRWTIPCNHKKNRFYDVLPSVCTIFALQKITESPKVMKIQKITK
jgi:hypothetical protein